MLVVKVNIIGRKTYNNDHLLKNKIMNVHFGNKIRYSYGFKDHEVNGYKNDLKILVYLTVISRS
jgi:hypothetical protein